MGTVQVLTVMQIGTFFNCDALESGKSLFHNDWKDWNVAPVMIMQSK